LALSVLAPAAQAASIMAESRFCLGYLGSADKPTLNCGSGRPQDANAAFQHTAVLTGIAVTNLSRDAVGRR
jgi:hypothetical protein